MGTTIKKIDGSAFLTALFIIVAGFFIAQLAMAGPSETISGHILSIDRVHRVIILQDASGNARSIAFGPDIQASGLHPGSYVRLRISDTAGGISRAEKIYKGNACDMTGIKRRLRKAAGFGGRGHHQGGRGHGHGRRHGGR